MTKFEVWLHRQGRAKRKQYQNDEEGREVLEHPGIEELSQDILGPSEASIEFGLFAGCLCVPVQMACKIIVFSFR